MEEVKNYSEHDIEEKSRSTDVIEDEKYFGILLLKMKLKIAYLKEVCI